MLLEKYANNCKKTSYHAICYKTNTFNLVKFYKTAYYVDIYPLRGHPSYCNAISELKIGPFWCP